MFPKKINSFPPFISKTAIFESGREGDAIMQGELQQQPKVNKESGELQQTGGSKI